MTRLLPRPWLALFLLATSAAAQPPANIREVLTAPVVPQGFGVNIHFTDPKPGEMQRFAEGGFGLVRMDLFWSAVEREPGKFDFSAYDRLVSHLDRAGAYPYFILCYANRLYDDNLPPHTDAGRAAYARFAAEAARHFKGRPVLWEIWNEPNHEGFWKPEPNADDYAKMALAAARAIKQADPSAVVLAPGSSGFPWPFLETIFEAGLLEHIDGVSVHPYRPTMPETAAADYLRLRALIARHAPEGKADLPIVSGEWGYSTVERDGKQPVSDDQQGRYLAREYLANVAAGVNVSIFYDWKDDGPDPKENEHRFGTVRQDLTPKPSFLAAQALIGALRGHSFRHRLAPRDPHDWRLLFQKGDTGTLTIAEWSTNEAAPAAARAPRFRVVGPDAPDYRGLLRLASVRFPAGARPEWLDRPAVLPVTIVNPEPEPAQILLSSPGLSDIPLNLGPGASTTLSLSLPVSPSPLPDDSAPHPLRITWGGHVLPAIAPVTTVRVDPLRLSVFPRDEDFAAIIENPSGLAISGSLKAGEKAAAELTPSSSPRLVVPLSRSLPPGPLSLVDASGRVLSTAALPRLAPLGVPADGFRSILHVDNKGQAPVPVRTVRPADPDAPSPVALAIPYTFDPGWRYLSVQPPAALKAPPAARDLSFWIKPDGSGNALRARIRDASGQTFQRTLDALDGTSWRPLLLDLSSPGDLHWGGTDDGVVHPPVTIETLLLIDSANQKEPRSGEVLLSSPAFLLAPGRE